MLVRSSALALCILTTFSPAALASATLRPLTLPVRTAGASLAPGTPSYAGDAFEVRVSGRASAALAIPARPGRLRQVGVPALDRAAAALGAWFEPEFAGETRPAPGDPAPDFTSYLIVHLPEGVALQDALARFAALGEVESVSPLAILPLTVVPNDSLFSLSPWFSQPSDHDIDAPEAWDVIWASRAVVALLDCGVVAGHPDLSGTIVGNSGNIFTNVPERVGAQGFDDDGNGFVDDVHGWDFVNLGAANEAKIGEDWRDEDNDPNDMAGHGTACAGLIGALTYNGIGVAGTAWSVQILPVRIGFAYPGAPLGSGEVRMDFVARGIRYATRMAANAINCSFATLDTDGLGAAVTAATRAGISVVVSAGNKGSPNDLGKRPDVISVAAVDGSDVVAAFSNTGPNVALAAPGAGMRSTYIQPTGTDSLGLRVPGYGSNLNGTSFSAPLVVGGIALLQGRELIAGRSPLSPEAVKLRLMESADDIRAQNPGLDGQYGAGRLNLFRMLTIPTPSIAIRAGGTTVGPSAVITRKSGPSRVAFATNAAQLVIVNADSTVFATRALPGPAATGVAAADLGGGHGVGLFVGTEDGSMAGFDASGQPLAGFPTPAIGIPLAGGPALGDIDGDGVLEIMCGADDGDLYAWRANGTLVPGFPRTTGVGRLRNPVALSEIDSLAPGVEIVATNEVGNLRVVRGNGSVINAYSKTYIATPRPPIVMRYGQGATAIVVAEGNQLHAYRLGGAEMSGFPVTLDGPVLSDLAIADLDVDGVLDLVLATDSPQQLDARDSTGAHLPGWPRPLGTGVVGTPVIGQLSGASSLFELLIFRGSGLRAFTNTGDSLALRPQSGGAGLFSTLVDLDADGETDIVAGTGADSAFYIYSGGPGSFTFGPTGWPTPRANMARTGSTRYTARPALVDDLAPAAINDLAAISVTGNTATLVWTAPGDDGYAGSADHYVIKQSTSPINSGNFDSAADVLSPPFPAAGGDPETLQVANLLEGVTYYFAIRAVDGAGNAGGISNVVNVTTSSVSPSQVTDVRVTDVGDTTVSLAWTASGDDGNVGRPSYYELRASTSPITAANFDDAPYQKIVYALVDAGGPESGVFGGLPRGAQLSIALKAVDLGGNASVLSNIVTVTTTGGPLTGKNGVAIAPAINPGRPPLSIYWQADPVGATGNQRMRFYDLGGRIQKSIEIGPGNSGLAVWDGRTDDGTRAPAGLYFIRFESGGHTAQARVALLP